MRRSEIIFALIVSIAILHSQAHAESTTDDSAMLCSLTGQTSEDWGAHEFELTKKKKGTHPSNDFFASDDQGHIYGRVVSKQPFVILRIPDFPAGQGLKSLVEYPLMRLYEFSSDFAVPEDEVVKLKAATFGTIIEGVDPRPNELCGVGESIQPPPILPSGYSLKSPLINIRVVGAEEHEKRFRSRSRLERSIASGAVFTFHWNAKDDVGKSLAIFRDGTVLATSYKLATVVHAKPQPALVENLFRSLRNSDLAKMQSDWSPMREGVFMMLSCARAQRIALAENEGLRSAIEPKVRELFSSLTNDVPTAIHYDEAVRVTVLDWPKTLPTLKEISSPQQSRWDEWRLKMASVQLGEQLWQRIPEPSTGPIGVNYDLYSKRIFFRDETGTYEIERARCKPSAPYCMPATAGALEIRSMEYSDRVVGESFYKVWPADLGVILENTGTKTIPIPGSVLESRRLIFERLAGASAKRPFVSGNYLFKGVAVYQWNLMD
ncbi:MAG: hypothetical protein QY326_01215 [Bdellovibrionota bacterium]|nr:MAG: hypothetical protein QY326_01215 [Bdellovibrionota bacterium]